jgi:hypothetical protein
MKSLEEIAREVALLVEDKQAQYGDAFGKSEQILKVLYPNGVKPEDYQNLLTITRIVDKLFRLATNNGNDREDPWRDICGYSLLSLRSKEDEH